MHLLRLERFCFVGIPLSWNSHNRSKNSVLENTAVVKLIARAYQWLSLSVEWSNSIRLRGPLKSLA